MHFVIEKNAKVSEPFDAGLAATGGDTIEIIEIIVPQELGIGYDPASQRLRGVPTVAGEHRLRVGYRLAGADTRLESECTLIVNADPRTLWKDLPSDRCDRDWKPDSAQRFMLGANGCSLLAASQRGRSHAHVGGFREDDFFLDVCAGWHILAVADGAGSAEHSRRGSQIATQRAGEWIKLKLNGAEGQRLDEAVARLETASSSLGALRTAIYPILGGATFAALKAIEAEANGKGKPVKDYATTLMLGLHGKTPVGHLFAACWVGDGAVAVYRRGVGVALLGAVDSGEYAGQTRFLDRAMVSSGEEIMQRLRLTITPDFTAFVLMSDGISDAKFETDRNLKTLARWDALWDELAPLLADEHPDARLLEWLAFWSPGNHDDRTLALLYVTLALSSNES